MQLTGKTIGLIQAPAGSSAEMARLCNGDRHEGACLEPLAEGDNRGWNSSRSSACWPRATRSPLHLLLNDETRGFLSAARLAQMKTGRTSW